MADEKQLSQIYHDLLFVKLFQTFRMAIQPSKLIITFGAIALISLAGTIMDVSNSVIISSQGNVSELQVYLANPDKLDDFIEANKDSQYRTGLYSTLWHFAALKLNTTVTSLLKFNIDELTSSFKQYLAAVEWAIQYHPIYCIIFILIKLAIIGTVAGAVCRIAALQFARDEKPGMIEALRFSFTRFHSLFAAPLVPLGIITAIGIFVFLLGLIGNIPWAGEIIVGIFTPFALLGGALMSVIAIGAIAGFNLLYPAIAYEGCDAFDSVSRSFSYVYSRPWRMALYSTIAAVYGSICYLFVRFFAFLLLFTTRIFVRLGLFAPSNDVNKLDALWPKPTFSNLVDSNAIQTSGLTQDISAFLINLSLLIVVGLLVAFILSFYFSANTIIYSALRKKVDDTDISDVFTTSELQDSRTLAGD
jgi:hypothetical protein